MRFSQTLVAAVLGVFGAIQLGAQTTAASQQPELTTVKMTFVPGEKTIFYDDFTDMGPGDPPSHFKVRGAGVELKSGGNIRQLTVSQRSSLFPNLKGLPKNFTFETEITVDGVKRALMNLILYSKQRQVLTVLFSAVASELQAQADLRAPKYQFLGRNKVAANWAAPVKIAVWVQNGRLRVFANGDKMLDFNQVEFPEVDQVELNNDFYGAGQSFGYRNVRFAESTPDFSQVIMANGRYVSYGILFDTDSDRLKPESATIIQSIAKGLETNPALKLLIEGHTDSVGQAAHNMDLSKRRAEAVKNVLVTQFKVDAARLTTAGLGSTKPVDSNDTPQGRSMNRRVEFVKQ